MEKNEMVSKNVLDILLFDEILQKVNGFCIAEDTFDVMKQVYPLTDYSHICTLHKHVTRMMDILHEKKRPAEISLVPSCKELLESHALKIFTEEELGTFFIMLRIIFSCIRWMDDAEYMPFHESMFPKDIYSTFSKIFNNEGKLIRENVKELQLIDNKKTHLHKKRHHATKKFINAHSDWSISDAPTIRYDRVVVGIKSSYKSKVKGVVHGYSATEKSIYIEPEEIYMFNNEMELLIAEEKQVVYALCKQLSHDIHTVMGIIKRLYDDFLHFDKIQAQAEYGIAYSHTFVDIATHQHHPTQSDMTSDEEMCDGIFLYGARHPLIDNAQPITIIMPKNASQLIITGPNAGGKTCALKTLGLLVIMHQSGIPLPALRYDKNHYNNNDHEYAAAGKNKGSMLPIFDDIHIVIGDSQSIHHNQSTFSSHMYAVHHAIKHTKALTAHKKQVLLLFDEFCAGTDDREGGALGWAILESLQDMNAHIMVTTHSALIKHYALMHARAVIAAIDPKNNYSILYGGIGTSEALSTAQKIGIEHPIQLRQQEILAKFGNDYNSLLREIQNTYEDAHKSTLAIQEKQKLIDHHLQAIESKKKELKEKEERFYNNVVDEGKTLLASMRKTLEKLTCDLNNHNTQDVSDGDTSHMDDISECRNTVAHFNDTITNMEDTLAHHRKVEATRLSLLSVGDEVYVKKSGIEGTIVGITKQNKYQITAGILTIELDRNELLKKKDKKPRYIFENSEQCTVLEESHIAQTKNHRAYHVEDAKSTTACVDVRGHTIEEALMAIDKQINSFIISHRSCFSIIHGKGKYILMDAIHKELKNNPHIKHIELATLSDGGSGKTYVYLQ